VAIEQGVAVSRGAWLLFTDPTRFTSRRPRPRPFLCVARAARRAEPADDQIVVTLAERAILPSILWTIAFGTGPLDTSTTVPDREGAVQRPVSARRALGERRHRRPRVGAREIAEDLELARRFKRDGGSARSRGRMPWFEAHVSQLPEIWDGFVKNLRSDCAVNPSRPAWDHVLRDSFAGRTLA